MTMTKPTTALTQWASRDDVREINERLGMMMLPGGKKLDAEQRLALAQASVMHGLDPFNGEIWIIPGSGVMIGIKGLRKKAREQVQGNFWCNFIEITNPEQRKRYGIPDGCLAFECRLFDTETIMQYVGAIEKFTKLGMKFEQASSMMGDQPYTLGIGFANPAENSKMTLIQRAMKRAEADAIKRRFDVPFGLVVGDTDEVQGEEWATIEDPSPADDGEYKPNPNDIDEALKAKREQGSKALYGEG